jgi:ABC-2 type transport system ATP-binding protein
MWNDPLPSPENAVEIRGLSRRFGSKLALNEVSFSIPAGSVLGLVGENGAGKTTLIKHVLGLLKAQSGTVRVFGKNPVVDPVGVLSRVGYLSEEVDLPDWMRVRDLMRYSQSFYPAWDPAFAERLRGEFMLSPDATIRSLSKGQRARAGLLVALSYRPDLLVLDEPSSGLDPMVRRDILHAIIRTVAEEGRTVLFSSHLLEEVERMSDYLAMIRSGRIEFFGAMEEVKEKHARVALRFEYPRDLPPVLDGALSWSGSGREWSVLWNGPLSRLEAAAAVLGGSVVESSAPTLDEIFVARASVGDAKGEG